MLVKLMKIYNNGLRDEKVYNLHFILLYFYRHELTYQNNLASINNLSILPSTIFDNQGKLSINREFSNKLNQEM